jgi:shikimate dehydrogenase
MHNAAYAACGIDDRFVFTAAHVQPDSLADAIRGARAMGIRGITCTIPHKVSVMPLLDVIDPVANRIGAVNTVVNDAGILKGYNTDWLGVVTPLERITSLSGKHVALVGAGGAARAVAYGVVERGATLSIYNRNIEKARAVADGIGEAGSVGIHPLEDIAKVKDADVIINATSLGMGDKAHETPVPADYLRNGQIVFDAVYAPYDTRLLREAQAAGATIVHGLDMLLYQGIAQFEIYTGVTAPEDIMRSVLMNHV